MAYKHLINTFAIIFIVCVIAVNTVAQEYFPPSESQGGWRSLVTRDQTPSASQKQNIINTVGLDWDKLKDAWDYHRSFTSSGAVVIIRHGWIAAEWGQTDRIAVASISKSITGMAIARLITLGLLDSEAFAYHYLPPGWDDNDARKRQIQVKHLMTMASGIDPFDGPYDNYNINFILNRTTVSDPEDEWSYSSLAVDLLGMMIFELTGKTAEQFLNDDIHNRIGAQVPIWGKLSGSSQTWTCCTARYNPRSLARMGYLMLKGGRWNSTQILSASSVNLLKGHASFLDNAALVDTANSPFIIPDDAPSIYGRLWWTNRTQTALGTIVPADAFYAHGLNERFLFIVPSLDLIAVRLGTVPGRNEPEFRQEFMRRVVEAIVAAPPAPASPCEVETTDGEVTGFAANGQEVKLTQDLHRTIDLAATQAGHQLSLYTWFGSTAPFANVQGVLDLDPNTQVKKVKCEAVDATGPPPAPASPCEVETTDGEVTGFAANGQEVKLTQDLHRTIDLAATQAGHQLSLYTWFGSTAPFANVQGVLDLDPNTQVKKVKCEAVDATGPPPTPASPCEVETTDGEVTGFAANGQEVKLTQDLHRTIDLAATQAGHQLSLYTWFGSTAPFANVQGVLDLDPNTQVKKVKCEMLQP